MVAQIIELPSDGDVDLAVGMLRLLGEPTRLRIVWALLQGEQSVNELAQVAGVSAAVASQHLAKLRLARLVRSRREGTRIYYSVDDEHVRGLLEAAVVHVAHRGPPATTSSRRPRARR